MKSDEDCALWYEVLKHAVNNAFDNNSITMAECILADHVRAVCGVTAPLML